MTAQKKERSNFLRELFREKSERDQIHCKPRVDKNYISNHLPFTKKEINVVQDLFYNISKVGKNYASPLPNAKQTQAIINLFLMAIRRAKL